MAKLQALFLDRDGVLNEDRPEGVRRLEDFCLLPGVLEALATLERAGVPVHVITNQALVGRGEAPRATVEAIHADLVARASAAGGRIASVQACYHAAEARCACRKPAPGLLLAAARQFGLDLAHVAFAGDDARDLEAAERAGAIPVLLLTGKGLKTAARVRAGEVRACATYPDVTALARAVVAEELS